MWILITNRATSCFSSLGYRQLPGLTVQDCPENPKGPDPSSVANTGSRSHSHQSPDYDARKDSQETDLHKPHFTAREQGTEKLIS